MKTRRQTQREARQLFQLCRIDGVIDENRVRQIVQRMLDGRHAGSLAVLSLFHRLVRLDRARHSADVQSAAPLPGDIRARIEGDLARRHGPGIITSFTENPALLGGVRIQVGSDVYDGSVQGGLSALDERFRGPA
jgi:F-type H+-transporting ATPase subunit delta